MKWIKVMTCKTWMGQRTRHHAVVPQAGEICTADTVQHLWKSAINRTNGEGATDLFGHLILLDRLFA